MLRNKKGQLDYPVITFIIIVFGLLIIAPFVLKIFNSIQTPMSNALGNATGGTQAAANFNKVMNTATTFWDKVVIAAFILALLLLIISAFLIDSSPVWLILYIFISLMVILFVPDIMSSLDKIYDSATFAPEVNAMPFIDWLRNNVVSVIVGVMVITGIIIYGKIGLTGGAGRK
jgi:hypothetical protein